MTELTKPIHRLTNKYIGSRRIVLTVAPGSETRETLIGTRLLGTRTQYVITLSDVHRSAALIYANKEKAARKQARKDGIPWKTARLAFRRNNTIPT